MAAPNMRKTAPALAGNGPPTDDRLGSAIDETNISAADPGQQLVRKLELARERLDLFTNDLAVIADWKADLSSRIARAQLKFNYVDCLSEDYELLRAELDDFTTVSHALAGRFPYEEAAP